MAPDVLAAAVFKSWEEKLMDLHYFQRTLIRNKDHHSSVSTGLRSREERPPTSAMKDKAEIFHLFLITAPSGGAVPTVIATRPVSSDVLH